MRAARAPPLAVPAVPRTAVEAVAGQLDQRPAGGCGQAHERATRAMGPPRMFRMAPDGTMREVTGDEFEKSHPPNAL